MQISAVSGIHDSRFVNYVCILILIAHIGKPFKLHAICCMCSEDLLYLHGNESQLKSLLPVWFEKAQTNTSWSNTRCSNMCVLTLTTSITTYLGNWCNVAISFQCS
jgi:hypothetical protein